MPTIPQALAEAVQHHQAGRLAQAEPIYRAILQGDDHQANVWQCLGLLLMQRGQPQDALDCFRRSIQLDGSKPTDHSNCGVACMAVGLIDEAEQCYRRALQIKSDYPEAHNNLGNVFQARGRMREALASYQTAVRLQPNFTDALNNLANAQHALGDFAAALAGFQRVVQSNPNHAEAHCNAGAVLQSLGRYGDAVASFQRAIELKPDFAMAHSNLGNALNRLGRVPEAVAWYQRALQLQPDYPNAHSNLLLVSQYRPGVSAAELQIPHVEFAQRFADPLRSTWQPHRNARDPSKPLRLGFVSPDLHVHPVGFFLIRVLENLDRQNSKVICYHNGHRHDEMTQRIQSAADDWRSIVGMSDAQLADQIRADGVDILVDLAGHTAHNRLLVFARKPAPLQITWLGYVGTTGLSAMDFILADRHEIPLDAEQHYVERVLRMPDGYVCFDPPSDAPPVSDLPALKNKFVTFGCFNNSAKLSQGVIDVWAEILRRLPDSRLLLKYRGLTDGAVADRIRHLFAAAGVEMNRVELQGWSPHAELLAAYRRVDLALDTFPYNGGLTTCEALWMGVPVITFPGETFAGRHSLSHLSTVGLTETIAREADDYVQLAVQFAQDKERLAAIRKQLRDQMASSPLCDGPRFAQHLLTLLRSAWCEWITAH